MIIFDNGGNTFDRYTVFFDNTQDTLSMSHNPNSPLGFCQYGLADYGEHLGEQIRFEDLPQACQDLLREVST